MTAPAIQPASIDSVSPPAVPDLSDAVTRARLSGAAAKAVVRLAERWQLSSAEASALAGVSPRTWARMKKGEQGAVLSQDELTRVSLLTGIFKALHIVFSAPLADDWIGLANSGPLYAGRRPVDVMGRGGIPAMIEVRRHVDALRGGL